MEPTVYVKDLCIFSTFHYDQINIVGSHSGTFDREFKGLSTKYIIDITHHTTIE